MLDMLRILPHRVLGSPSGRGPWKRSLQCRIPLPKLLCHFSRLTDSCWENKGKLQVGRQRPRISVERGDRKFQREAGSEASGVHRYSAQGLNVTAQLTGTGKPLKRALGQQQQGFARQDAQQICLH